MHLPSNFYSIWFSSLPPPFLIFPPSSHLSLHSLCHHFTFLLLTSLLLSSSSSPSFLSFPLSFLSLLLSLSVPLFPYTPHYQFISSQQLAPTVQGSESAHNNGLEQTLLERLAFMVRSDSISCVYCLTPGHTVHSTQPLACI